MSELRVPLNVFVTVRFFSGLRSTWMLNDSQLSTSQLNSHFTVLTSVRFKRFTSAADCSVCEIVAFVGRKVPALEERRGL